MREATACVFVKPPRPGEVKTRLVPEVSPEAAAELAAAFLADTLDSVRRLAWLDVVVATADRRSPSALSPTLGGGDGSSEGVREIAGFEVWPQGPGDLGARMERVLRRALARSPVAIALGTDSPGLPRARLEEARQALRTADAVLGPAEDGGFYLLGLRRCPQGLLHGLPWSSDETLARTEERLRRRGLRTARISPWFDVDRPDDLDRLADLLALGAI